jgi:hypothetical protein
VRRAEIHGILLFAANVRNDLVQLCHWVSEPDLAVDRRA